MSEDEEILPDNSDLSHYLRRVGFTDLKTMRSGSSSEKFAVSFSPRNGGTMGFIEEDVIAEIEILLSAKLIFEEDVLNMKNLLTNFTKVKTGVLRNMFHGPTAALAILMGLLLYYIIGGYVFILLSTFYAYRTSDYLWKKHFSHQKLKKMVYALQENYILLRKAMRFINENDEILKTCNIEKEESKQELKYYFKFKNNFVTAERRMVELIIKATRNLIKTFPLLDNIEKVPFYVCNSFDDTFVSSLNETKLHQFYSLIQSEFLQRVMLTLIPNIQLSYNENNFHKIIRRLTLDCQVLGTEFNKRFKFVFLNGVFYSKNEEHCKVPVKTKTAKESLTCELVANLHTTSNKLQTLLIKSREVEDELSRASNNKTVEQELLAIQHDLNTCQSNIADSLIYINKLITPHNTEPSVQLMKDEREVSEQMNNIRVGYTDLDPIVSDEIFEAEILNDNARDHTDNFALDDVDKRNQVREYETMLKELRVRLVSKAAEWNEREANAVRHRLDEGAVEQQTVNWPLKHVRRCRLQRKSGRIVKHQPPQTSSSEGTCDLKDRDHNLNRLSINAALMQTLLVADKRETVGQGEEVFGASEDSDLEEC